MSKRTSTLISLVFACGLVATGLQSQSLETTFAGTNGNNANAVVMFDVDITHVGGITIEALDVHTQESVGSPVNLILYQTDGSYVGNELTPSAWRQIASGSGVSAGFGVPTRVNLATPVTLQNGKSGLGVQLTDAFVRYSNGGAPLVTYPLPTNPDYPNQSINLTAGVAVRWTPSPILFSPRIWNGRLHYSFPVISGPHARMPLSYIVSRSTTDMSGTSIPHRQMYTKRGGRGAGVTNPPRSQRFNLPVFTWTALFGRYPSLRIDIDAMSIGLDQLWVQCSSISNYVPGRMNAPQGSWMEISTSRKPELEGESNADIYGYLPENLDTPVPTGRYSNSVHKSIDSGDVDVRSDGEIVAIDSHIPLYSLDDPALNLGFPGWLPSQPYFYFSVTKATAGDTARHGWNFDEAGFPASPSGANIYRMQWTGTGWTTPRIFLRPFALGLGLQNDVDGLAIDSKVGDRTGCNPEIHIVYSPVMDDPTAPLPTGPITWSELMFINRTSTDGPTPPPTPYTASDGEPVNDKNGNRPVVSVCTDDPGFLQTPPPLWTSTDFPLVPWGTPLEKGGEPIYGRIELSTAVYRGATTAFQPELTYVGSGWSEAGPRTEFVFLLLGFDYTSTAGSVGVLSGSPCSPSGPCAVDPSPLQQLLWLLSAHPLLTRPVGVRSSSNESAFETVIPVPRSSSLLGKGINATWITVEPSELRSSFSDPIYAGF